MQPETRVPETLPKDVNWRTKFALDCFLSRMEQRLAERREREDAAKSQNDSD